jgi:1-acyl-sn-glycerol-3-phosphate acyltransferase
VFTLLLQGVSNQLHFFLKNIGSQLYALYCWVLFISLAPLAWLAVMILPRIEWRWTSLHWMLRFLFKMVGAEIIVTGNKESLSVIPTQILVANHLSYLDPFVLMTILPKPICFIAKSELLTNSLLSIALIRIGTQFVERFELEKSLEDTRKIEKSLDQNRSLLFFPEGTFDRLPGLLPFHSGAFFLAAKNELTLTPMCIKGTRSILRDGSWFPRYGPIEIVIGNPQSPSQIPEEFNRDTWKKTDFLKYYALDFIQQHNQEPKRSHAAYGPRATEANP